MRVESCGGSEVLSGDEGEGLATGTSSDIEVLSYRGHARGGSDSSVGEEMEALKKKNRELEEVVAAREARLVAVAKEMAALQGEVEDGGGESGPDCYGGTETASCLAGGGGRQRGEDG